MRQSTRIRKIASAVWLGLLLMLSACGEPTGSQQPLAMLDVPHVTKIPGAERLTATGPHQIDALATYLPANEDKQAHILALVGEHLYDLGIDGSNMYEVHLAHSCIRSLSVTPDGRWGACQYEQGIETFGLSGSDQGKTHLIAGDPARLSITPSWAPDGKHLAVGSRSRDGGDGMVNIYTASPAYDELQLTARLIVPFASVDDVSWSADGTWLGVSGATGLQSGFHYYLVRMTSLVGRLYGHEDAPVTLAVGQDDMLPLTDSQQFTWFHRAASSPATQLTIVQRDGQTIARRDVLTGQATPIVAQRAGYICGLSWTPDDRHLVFVLCGRFSDVVIGPPAQLYVYTSPN